MGHRLTFVLPGLFLGVAGLLVGCSSTPTGSTGGRIDSYRTTDSDRVSRKANIPSLLEFTDQVSQELAAQLASIPEIRTAETRQVLELGSIQNKTQTVAVILIVRRKIMMTTCFNLKMLITL